MQTLFLYLLTIIIALILEVALPPHWAKPDFLLIITVTAGLLRGASFAVGIGFVTGMIQDIFLGGFFGIITLVKMITGGISGLIEGNFFKENYLIPPLVIFLASIFHGILRIILSENLLFNLNILTAFRLNILPEAIVNAIIGFIFYFIFQRLDAAGGSQNG